MWFRRRLPVDVAEVRRNIGDAIAWCAPRTGDPVRLRTPELTSADALNRLLASPDTFLAQVITKRRTILEESGARSPDAALAPSGGRLLRCEYWSSLLDRACHIESHGFLDDDDLPPAGTWIGLIPGTSDHRSPLPRPKLIAWIPGRHVPDVSAAMPCCPMETNAWLDEVDPRLARALLRAG